MKTTFTAKVGFTLIVFSALLVGPLKATAQLPNSAPSVQPIPTVAPTPNIPTIPPTMPPDAPPTLIMPPSSHLVISCQGRNTIAQKGSRKAVFISWNTNHFGSQYTPEKRCQIVSQKLHNVAMVNGGTLKGLNLRSGLVNRQVVVCALGSGQNQCDSSNMLFTLKPENARNPGAVIQQIVTFSQIGSGTINEDSGEELNVDLGTWEDLAFPPDFVSEPRSNPATTDIGF